VPLKSSSSIERLSSLAFKVTFAFTHLSAYTALLLLFVRNQEKTRATAAAPAASGGARGCELKQKFRCSPRQRQQRQQPHSRHFFQRRWCSRRGLWGGRAWQALSCSATCQVASRPGGLPPDPIAEAAAAAVLAAEAQAFAEAVATAVQAAEEETRARAETGRWNYWL
jgi:hypothetical protein